MDYAENHLDEIMQRKAHVHCADDVMCRDILSNMGTKGGTNTNSWNKQLEEKGADAMSSEMSNMGTNSWNKQLEEKGAEAMSSETSRHDEDDEKEEDGEEEVLL
jgi:hypothetical protein